LPAESRSPDYNGARLLDLQRDIPENAIRAIRVDIDSIEYGTFLDDEAMLMIHDPGG